MRISTGHRDARFCRGLFVAVSVSTAVAASLSRGAESEAPPYRDPSVPVEERARDLRKRLSIEEKVSLLSGGSYMDTREIERLGIPALKMADGPHGVRVGKATCFPTEISMGASWNVELIRRVGVALARETRARGRNILLGPCVNIHRTPLGGRNFESFSEDPYLAARLAVAYVHGVQSQRIGTSVKHLAVNNQERERTTISAEVDERTLREIYLPAFKAAVTEADAWTVMGAYNKVNGHYCCANRHLLTEVLKEEWGFRGLVVSDWGGTHSSVKSANAGLDLEMPGPGRYFSGELLKAVRNGEVSLDVINDKVERILRVQFLLGLYDGVEQRYAAACEAEEHAGLARELAGEAIVLLKNRDSLLPLSTSKIRSLAVIGPLSDIPSLGGGGSSTVTPSRWITPLQGIKKALGSRTRIRHLRGCSLAGDELSPASGDLLRHAGAGSEARGLKAEYFRNRNLEGKPALSRIDESVNFDWGAGAPCAEVGPDEFSVRWTGVFTPKTSGNYDLGVACDDGFRLYLDGELLVEAWHESSLRTGKKSVWLEGGRGHDLRIEYFEASGDAVVIFGWHSPEKLDSDVAKVAAESDAAVVFAGLSWRIEGEGVDKANLGLPGAQAELIRAVARANKNTVVVLTGGTPVVMDEWLNDVGAVLLSWYPGQEGGGAIADILTGKTNPSGKIPVTFPKRLEDSPSFSSYPGRDGKVHYPEGIFVGYRHFDAQGVEPLFPFGHGLSYTRFFYENLRIDSEKRVIGFEVENVGRRAGKEVIQLYVRDVESSVERPPKELKGFIKISLSPGERRGVSIPLNREALAFYHPDRMEWVVEPGEFEILVGSSSSDIRLRGGFFEEVGSGGRR